MKKTAYSQYTFRDSLRVIFRRRAIVVTALAVVFGATYLGLQMQTPFYNASVRMLITAKKQVEATYYKDLGGGTPEKLAVTQSEIVKSTPVLERVVSALELYRRPLNYEFYFASPFKKWMMERKSSDDRIASLPDAERHAVLSRIAADRLKASIDVEPVRDTNTFVITVSDYDPVAAAVIANTLSRSYVIFDLEQQLAELQLKYGTKHPQVKQVQDHIDKLNKTLDGNPISNADAIGPASVKIIEQASVPLRSEGKSHKVFLALALVMGLGLGVVLAFLFEYMDTTFKIPLDIENYLGLPVLGSIPKWRGRRGSFYQELTERVYLQMKEKGMKTLMVAPVQPNGTARSAITELARYMAQKTARKVLLIDANLRTPDLHKSFRTPETPGLAEVIENKTPLDKSVKRVEENFYFMSAGRTKLNPLPLLDTLKMKETMSQLNGQFDLVVIYSPQLERNKDAVILAGYADATIVMIEESHTRKEVAQFAIQPLEERNTNLIGAVLNGRTFPIPRILYGIV